MDATSDREALGAATARVAGARDNTMARYGLAAEFYSGGSGTRRPYRRAELSFLGWETSRGVLNPVSADRPGSRWWRAVNDRLLRDKVEADLLDGGAAGPPSARSVEFWLDFINAPSAATWYRAHNSSVVSAFVDHEDLASPEHPIERFMMNVALLRVIFAHALTTAPRLALGRLAPLARPLGDPRRGTVGWFLDLRNVFPARYPLDDAQLEEVIASERRLGRVLDYGIIGSRASALYGFAATALEQPMVTSFVTAGVPSYACPPAERALWYPEHPGRLVRLVALATRPSPAMSVDNR